MRALAVILFFGLSLLGCSSGSDGPLSESLITDVRIASSTIDSDNDGMPEVLVEYEYDSSGRIISASTSSPITLSEPSTIRYTYGADGLATRDNGVETETFFYEAGRVSRIESSDSFTGALSYTYDGAGRLSSVVGDAFFFDDDCDSAVVPPNGSPAELVLQSYQLAYTANRLSSITGSLGDVITLVYNPQGNLSTLSTTGCDGAIETVATFRYGPDGLPSGSTTEVFDEFLSPIPATTELVAGYSNGLLTSVVETDNTSFSNESTSITFSYDDRSLLVASTVVVEESFGNDTETTSTSLSFGYEDASCAGQQTAYPHLAVFLDIAPRFQPGDLAIACTYNLDNF